MDDSKVRLFKALADQKYPENFDVSTPEKRKLGAQLLLSETLEYVIKGLGVTPTVSGTPITEADALQYEIVEDRRPSPLEMIDGLADVAYTMYWNSVAFKIPLDQAYDLVCDNNLEKFVHLQEWSSAEGPLTKASWDCNIGVVWPKEVSSVEVVKVNDSYYAVGKDARGKVRKPSTYKPVDLSGLLPVASNE